MNAKRKPRVRGAFSFLSEYTQVFGNDDGYQVDEEENDFADEQKLQKPHDPMSAHDTLAAVLSTDTQKTAGFN